jgi:hypothetical protein
MTDESASFTGSIRAHRHANCGAAILAGFYSPDPRATFAVEDPMRAAARQPIPGAISRIVCLPRRR